MIKVSNNKRSVVRAGARVGFLAISACCEGETDTPTRTVATVALTSPKAGKKASPPARGFCHADSFDPRKNPSRPRAGGADFLSSLRPSPAALSSLTLHPVEEMHSRRAHLPSRYACSAPGGRLCLHRWPCKASCRDSSHRRPRGAFSSPQAKNVARAWCPPAGSCRRRYRGICRAPRRGGPPSGGRPGLRARTRHRRDLPRALLAKLDFQTVGEESKQVDASVIDLPISHCFSASQHTVNYRDFAVGQRIQDSEARFR